MVLDDRSEELTVETMGFLPKYEGFVQIMSFILLFRP